MLPKELYVVVDCEKFAPGKYRVMLNKGFKQTRSLMREYGLRCTAWSPYEGIITITLSLPESNILEVSTEWVDRHKHPPRKETMNPDLDAISTLGVSGYYQIEFLEAQVLTVGSIIVEPKTPVCATEGLILSIEIGNYDEDIEKVLKKFNVSNYKSD